MNTYGSLSLTEASPPQIFSEPLTLSEVKTFLNLDERSPTDAEEDTMLESFIIGAREVAEMLQGRDLIEKQYDLSLDYFPCEQIELRDPLVTVDLVRYRDSDGAFHALTEDTDYIVDIAKHPGIVMPAYGETWPSFTAWPSSAVLIRFTSGYSASHLFWSDAGQRILTGMKYLIREWFDKRIAFTVWSAQNVLEYPYTITTLLSFGASPRVR